MKRKRKLPKKYFYRRLLLIVCSLVLVVGIYGLGHWLAIINQIEIVGTKRLSDQQILKVIDLREGDSYPTFRKGALEKQLESLNYVKESKIRYQFPKKMKVTIQEELPVAQIKDKSGFLLLNKDLKILEKTRSHSLDLIEISGISTKDLIPGKTIFDTKLNKSKIDFFSEFFNHDVQSKVKTIEFKEQGLHLTLKNGIKVLISSFKDAGYKLTQLEMILDQVQGQEEEISTILLDQGENPIAIRKGEDSLLTENEDELESNDKIEKKGKKTNDEKNNAENSNSKQLDENSMNSQE